MGELDWARTPSDNSLMTITIELPLATLEQLKAEAQVTGKDVETLVREAVEATLARRKRTFAEILKSVHDEVEASGMREEEVDALLQKELKAVEAERRSPQAPRISAVYDSGPNQNPNA
jgi:hypothetical protein